MKFQKFTFVHPIGDPDCALWVNFLAVTVLGVTPWVQLIQNLDFVDRRDITLGIINHHSVSIQIK
jgi:hypothetical protein